MPLHWTNQWHLYPNDNNAILQRPSNQLLSFSHRNFGPDSNSRHEIRTDCIPFLWHDWWLWLEVTFRCREFYGPVEHTNPPWIMFFPAMWSMCWNTERSQRWMDRICKWIDFKFNNDHYLRMIVNEFIFNIIFCGFHSEWSDLWLPLSFLFDFLIHSMYK